jgi:hypothetical protein
MEAAMKEADVRKKLAELSETLRAWPVSGLGKPADPPLVCASGPSAAEGPIQDAFDFVRLQVKYIVFDLEATRRENRYLRQILGGRGGSVYEGDGNF